VCPSINDAYYAAEDPAIFEEEGLERKRTARAGERKNRRAKGRSKCPSRKLPGDRR